MPGAFSSGAFSALAYSTDDTPVPPTPTPPERISAPRTVTRRRELSQRVVLDDGTAITIRVLDGILVDDLLISSMKAEGYRVMTGRDTFPAIDRKLKDYLIKTGIIQE